jgi:hypothetical protein
LQGDPRFDWRDAQSLTEMNIRDLELDQGEEYVVIVQAVNGAGLSSLGLSAPVQVDVSPPQPPEIRGFQQSSLGGLPNSLRIGLQPPADDESGIVETAFALGTSEGGTDLLPWTALGEVLPVGGGSFGVAGLPLVDGQTVHLTTRAVNGAGATARESAAVTVGFVDTTGPAPAEAAMQPERYSVDPTSLTIGWSAGSDGESGIQRYEYALGSGPDRQDVIGWTSVAPLDAPQLLSLGSGDAGDGSGGKGSGIGRSGGGFTGGGQWGTGGGEQRGSSAPAGTDYLGGRLMQEGALETEYRRELSGLDLAAGGSYYLQVRTVNGAGLTALSTAGPLTVDLSPPEQLQLSLLSLGKGGRSAVLELAAEDRESGISSYRWEVVQGSRRFGSPTVRYNSGWQAFTGAGSKVQTARELSVSIPRGVRGSGKQRPRVRVWVMNGAGLTRLVGSWEQGASAATTAGSSGSGSGQGVSPAGLTAPTAPAEALPQQQLPVNPGGVRGR